MTTFRHFIPIAFGAQCRLGAALAWRMLLALALSLPALNAVAQASASEERVKAASLSKFPNYVEWPATAFPKPDSSYVLGVMNADDVAEELTGLVAGRTVNNRPLTVKKLQPGDSLAGVHVLFIGKAERARQAQLLRQLQRQPVLVVTETDGALTQGSMINFRLADERVRFEVALEPVEKSGLKLNSRLLSVALAVVKGQP